MRHYKINTRLIVAAFAASAAIASSSSADVFRGVRAHDNGVVRWEHDANNFGVSGQPPSLSFFHLPNNVIPQEWAVVNRYDCLIRVFLPDVQEALVGEAGNIPLQIMHGGASQNFTANFPWRIVNDDNPPGHWSILGKTILDGILPDFNRSNTLASKVAVAGFRYLAQNDPQVTVIPGTNPNCSAQ
jgi:hypothetical protein